MKEDSPGQRSATGYFAGFLRAFGSGMFNIWGEIGAQGLQPHCGYGCAGRAFPKGPRCS
jgi:hypothetical protein